MEKLQLREKEIFETLKKIRNFSFVVIGGYAVNPYTLPRFSVDCDIVILNDSELNKMSVELEDNGYKKQNIDKENFHYHGKFLRYEKNIAENINASFDILIKEVYDRETKVSFDAEWIFKNSSLISLIGKTINERVTARIININALIVMKFISCRESDIRDLFMLMTKCNSLKLARDEISKRYDFSDRFSKIKERITSKEFRDNLQGVYGKVDDKIFDKYKKSVLSIAKL